MADTFLALGHVTRDFNLLVPGASPTAVAGGAVYYASHTAHRMGYRTAVVTSSSSPAASKEVMPDTDVITVPSDHTTTFLNDYTFGERVQRLTARAGEIAIGDVPKHLLNPAAALLCPLAGELPLDSLSWFGGSVTGAVLQGFLRRWDAEGMVSIERVSPPRLQKKIELVVVSSRELERAAAEEWAQLAEVVALTSGSDGVEILTRGGWSHLDAPEVSEADPTGAGDVWAAAYLAHFARRGSRSESASFACMVAAQSVTAAGVSAIDPGDWDRWTQKRV
jgi:1D-myo-inositol 3-kinase